MQSNISGKLVTWKADKAYGFIRPDTGGKDVFVHLRDFGRIPRPPREGDVVTFQKMSDGSGRLRAADVSIRGLDRIVSQPRGSTELAPRSAHLLVALGAFAALGYLVVTRRLPIPVFMVFLAMSIGAFVLYAFDKSAALNRRWRTKESTLLVAGLLGGWPGALVAQGMFRHKSSKVAFQAAFWFTVILNCTIVAWWSFFQESG